MRKRDGSVGKFTYKHIRIEEIFRVDALGCTVVPDTHSATQIYKDPGSKANVCVLCDYLVVREAWITDNALVSGPTSALEGERGLPERVFPAGDPAHKNFTDNRNFHLFRYSRRGNKCLLREKVVDDYHRGAIKAKGRKGSRTLHWKMTYWWAIPCGSEVVPMPPPSTPQPPCGSNTGIPTITTSPSFRPDGLPLKPGEKGWRRGPFEPFQDGEGRYPVPEGGT
jgi:hypothetical protein